VTETSAHREEAGSLLGGISSQFRINPFTDSHLEVRAAHGATIETTDGRTYLDMFMAHGSTVLGHGHPAVMAAIREHLDDGVVIGYETPLGESVARRLSAAIPSAEAVRFTASGSEAVASAMRLARAHTGRDIVVKIDGHFNGGSDYAMVNSLAAYTDASNEGGRPSRPILSSGGIPRVVAETIVPVPWDDLSALEAALRLYADQVAAVIMVPIDFNNGCLTPTAGYLAAVHEMTHAAGALLLFDEVLSGFKTGLGGAQVLYGVTPDLTMLSKAMSSGVPLSAVVGRREVMETLMKPVPAGAVQGGTFAGNALGLAAAEATLEILAEPGFYPSLLPRVERFFAELQGVLDRSPIAARVQHAGVMFAIYLGTREPVTSYAHIRALDAGLRRRFFSRVIERGVYFHTDFSVSSAHDDALLADVLERVEDAARATASED
jgi:glutamate-1-semialdehyde 2,1-aminomutase